MALFVYEVIEIFDRIKCIKLHHGVNCGKVLEVYLYSLAIEKKKFPLIGPGSLDTPISNASRLSNGGYCGNPFSPKLRAMSVSLEPGGKK